MNPGDRVRFYKPGHYLHGKEGTLLYYTPSRDAVVDFGNGAGTRVPPWDIQPADELPPQTT